MGNVFKTAKTMVKGNLAVYIWSFVFQFLMCVATVFSSFLTSVLVDAYMHQLDRAAYLERWVADLIAMGQGDEFLYTHLDYIAFWILGATAVTVVVAFIRHVLRARAASRINKHIQDVVYAHLLSLPFRYYKETKPGDLIQTATTDLDTMRKFMIMQASMVLYALWMSIFSAIILFQISWELAVASLILMPPLFIYSFFFIKKVRRAYRAADDAEAQIVDRINDNLNGVRVIKAFSAERKEIDLFEKDLQAYRKVSKYDRWLESFFFSTSDIFIFASRSIAVIVGVYLCYVGKISGGAVAISFTFVNMMVWPLRSAAQTLSAFGQTMAAADRIQLLLNAKSEDTHSGSKVPLKGQISFSHVSFHYPDEPEVEIVEDVSFDVKAGSTLAIMGKTGSGKSTLYALLTRLYEPDEGTISFDGIDGKDIAKDVLRRDIASVLQDPFLFSRSIEDNIKITRPDASHESVLNVARIADIDTAIEGFEKGYETPVGEKGVTLSGGQKQRLAIARALLPGAPIVVFDDSLSAVDAATDLAIRTRLEKEAKGATKILITHRINTAKDADLILMMDQGRIAEMGTHQQLVQRNGLYAEIAKIQGNVKEAL